MSRRILHLLFVGLLLTLELLWVVPIQPVSAAPAPPLTYLQVKLVRSQTKQSWEPINDFQLLTITDHGGGWLEVVTTEKGYGKNLIARYNQQKMTLISSTPFPPSGTIEGWHRLWRINTTITNGTFTYQATSINSPWNTMSDRLSIK